MKNFVIKEHNYNNNVFINKGIFCYVMFFIYISCVSYVFAADDDPLAKDYGEIANSMYVASGVGGNIGGRAGAIGGPGSSKLVNDSNTMVQGEKLEESEIADRESLKVTPGTKQSDFHTYIPKKQFTEFLKSKEWEDIYDKSIKDNAASMIGSTTWNLANSSVGEARFYALMQAQKAIRSHYLAELSFIKQVEQNPYMRQGITDAYFSCVRKQMKEGKKEGNENITWFEAQEKCMGDRGIDKDTSDKFGLSPKLFDYNDVYDHKDRDGKVICLSDYLFSQEEASGSDSKSTNSEGIDKLKELYKKLFGDVEFEIQNDKDDVPGMREIKYTFYFPGGQGGKFCDIPNDSKSPSELYYDVLQHRYNLLITALGTYCQSTKRKDAGTSTGPGTAKSVGISEFIKKDEYISLVETYKAGGYNITPMTIDNLYKIVNDTSKIADDGMVDCNAFSDLYISDTKDLYTFGNDNDDPSKQYKSFLYSIAKSVTDVTVMKLYSFFYRYLQNTTTGTLGVNSPIYQIADAQINQIVKNAFGSRTNEISISTNKIIENVGEINVQVNDQINAQSRGLTDVKRDGVNNAQQNEDFVSPN